MSTPPRPVVLSDMRPTGRLHPLLTQAPKILGTDGRKTSESYGNTIDLGEGAEATESLLPAQARMRERREALLARPEDLDDIVQLGIQKARAVAQRTVGEVRHAMKMG